MPRSRSRSRFFEAAPLTAAEVTALWHQAGRRGPYPSLAACEVQAQQLTALIGHAAADRIRAQELDRTGDAVRLALQVISAYLLPFDAVYGNIAKKHLPPPFRLLSVEEYSIFTAARPTLVEVLSVMDPFNFTLSPEQAIWFGSIPGGSERLAKLQQRVTHRKTQLQRARAPAPVWEGCAVACWLLARDALSEIGRKAGTSRESVATKFAALATQRLGFPGATAPALERRLLRIARLAE